jgi:hypothetical protein
MTTTATAATRRELGRRRAGDAEISLFWDEVGDTILLEIYEADTGELYLARVPRHQALDAFRHPYVYLAVARAFEPLAA